MSWASILLRLSCHVCIIYRSRMAMQTPLWAVTGKGDTSWTSVKRTAGAFMLGCDLHKMRNGNEGVSKEVGKVERR